MVDQLVEAVADQPIRHRLLEPGVAELQHEAFAQIARADAWRVEPLHRREHSLAFLLRVQRHFVRIALRRFGGLEHHIVDRLTNLVDRTRQISVLVDVADELLGEEHLPRVEIEQRDLVAQVVAEIARGDGDRLVVLLLLVLLSSAAGVEAIEQDLLPVDLVVRRLLFLRCLRLLGFRSLLFVLFLGLDHLEERIVQQLLLEVLLEVEQRHVQQIHRLVQARIDLQLLPELRALIEPGLHWLGSPTIREASAQPRRERGAEIDLGDGVVEHELPHAFPTPSPARRT